MAWRPPASPSSLRLKIVLTILFHCFCSIWSILQNKTALNSLNAPLLLLVIQTFVQVILLTVVGLPMGWIKVHNSLAVWIGLVPIVLSKLVSTILKTYTLAYVNASFYQLSRGLLLPFTLLLSILFIRPRPTFPPFVLVGCFCVTFGFTAGTITDLGAALTKPTGMILGALGSLATAADTVIIKRFLNRNAAIKEAQAKAEDTKDNEWAGRKHIQLAWQMGILSLGLYIPVLLISGEHASLWEFSSHHSQVSGKELLAIHAFYQKAIISGVASTLLIIATFLQLDVTSPTTHMVVSAARGVAQSLIAVAVLGEIATSGRALGMAFVVGGSALYGWARDREATAKRIEVVNMEEEKRLTDDVAQNKEHRSTHHRKVHSIVS